MKRLLTAPVTEKDFIDRDSKAYKYIEGLLLLVGIVVGATLFLAAIVYLLEMTDGGFSVAGLIGFAKLFVVLILGFIVWRAKNRAEDSLDAWNQSFLERREEEELRETFRRGGTIFYNNVECEVWNDQFVPKKDGITLQKLSEADADLLNERIEVAQEELAARDRQMWQRMQDSLNRLVGTSSPKKMKGKP